MKRFIALCLLLNNGIRYGLVQFDEVSSVAWWASTFCMKGCGATVYRLRDDIAYREE